MRRSSMEFITRFAMKITVPKREEYVLEAFFAICNDELLLKIDCPLKRDWTCIRTIKNKKKTQLALKRIHDEYLEGATHLPHEVVSYYDELVN